MSSPVYSFLMIRIITITDRKYYKKRLIILILCVLPAGIFVSHADAEEKNSPSSPPFFRYMMHLICRQHNGNSNNAGLFDIPIEADYER